MAALVFLGTGCSGRQNPPAFEPKALEGAIWGEDTLFASPGGQKRHPVLDSLASLSAISTSQSLSVVYPIANTLFPPEIIPPTVLWTDSTDADFWIVEGRPAHGKPFFVLTSSPPLPAPAIDSAAIPRNTPMEIPDPNRYRNWTPSATLWKKMKSASVDGWLNLRIHGFRSSDPYHASSAGAVAFRTSPDSVGAPIFYRDVPIMPTINKSKRIAPLSRAAERLIRWSLRDVSRPLPKTVIPTLPTCANCHSFSRDGGTVGLDLDGPQNDKGAYGLARLERETKIERRDMFSWNYGFRDKPKGKKTIGFLSQVSPDARYVATTVNEEVYIHNYMNNKYIQVFYPTRGVLAFYDSKSGNIKTLPGADNPAFVHCDPSWTPDGNTLIFARARAKDAFTKGQPDPEFPNDSNETQIKYELYRIPFNGGRGGRATPIAGASGNGMSNNFPKVTPDGKFIVFVQCRNGQLLRPDGMLKIVPIEGGEARLMNCNTPEMNSWHSFAPNGRWMVFSSKGYSPYTQMFLTHIDADGMDSPPVLVSNATAANRAVNLPEFVNRHYEDLDRIEAPAIRHMQLLQDAYDLVEKAKPVEAIRKMHQALEVEKQDGRFRSEVQMLLGWLYESGDSGLVWVHRAIATDPDNSLAHFNLGIMLDKRGRVSEAMHSYRRSVEIDPANAWGLIKMSRIHMQGPDPKLLDIRKSIDLAEQASRLSKYREPSILKSLARAYSEAGRFGEALKTAHTALDLAKQQGLAEEVDELQNEIPVYEHGKSFTWALKRSRDGAPPDPNRP